MKRQFLNHARCIDKCVYVLPLVKNTFVSLLSRCSLFTLIVGVYAVLNVLTILCIVCGFNS